MGECRDFFLKPYTSQSGYCFLIGDNILQRRVNSNLSNMNIVITGPTGSGKTETCSYLLSDNPNNDLIFPRMITTRIKRPDEIGSTSYIHLTEEQFERAVQDGSITLVHHYGSDRIENSDNIYGVLRRPSEDIPESYESHSISEGIDKYQSLIFTISGINHKKVWKKYSNTINFEIISPPAEGEEFLRRRGSDKRILRRLLDIIELSKDDPDDPAAVYLFNRDLLNGTAETLPERIERVGNPLLSHSRMFSRLDHPSTSKEYFSRLIDHLISRSVLCDNNPCRSISDLLSCKKKASIAFPDEELYTVLGGDERYSLIEDMNIPIISAQKIKRREQYVIVLKKPKLQLEDYMPRFKEYFRLMIESIVGRSYLLCSDVWDEGMKKYFPYETGIKVDKADYDLMCLLGSQMMIRDGVIEDKPSLAIVFSDKPGDISLVESDEIFSRYRSEINKEAKRYFSGHFFRQKAYWDACHMLRNMGIDPEEYLS